MGCLPACGQEQWAASGSSCQDLSTAVVVGFVRRWVFVSPGQGCVPRTGGAEGDVEPGLPVPPLWH
ncbi:hypothetical protein [Saccharothrix deserti]|uniref:hypothetical protein n=1 Tax=Saccharothrix deserti TaxID=2593674 RepID=UPI00131DF1B9|nr:hypothetical protein [Saccharothrix deserti]